MKHISLPTRRQFLQQTAVTSAACGLAHWSDANDTQVAESAALNSIIDTHTYIGRWPFRYVSNGDTNELESALTNNGVIEAWVGTFDGLLHKDIAGANERLSEACRDPKGCTLRPFGSINPTLPDWEEDVRRCHEQFHMPGIRLHPNYHGYTLDDPRFSRLLQLAASHKLVVQLVTWLDDERHAYLNPPVKDVDLGPLEKIVAATNELRFVLAIAFSARNDTLIANLARLPNVFFDFASLNSKTSIADLTQVTANRVVFGSTAPLLGLESAVSRLRTSKLRQDQLSAISHETARKLTSSASN